MDSLPHNAASHTVASKRPLPVSEKACNAGEAESADAPKIARKREAAIQLTYDTFFIDNTEALEQLLWYYHHVKPEATKVYLTCLQDLENTGLVQQTIVDQHVITVRDGPLLSGQAANARPIILFIDFRNMNPGQRLEFNALFESPSRLGRKSLAADVQIISLVHKSMDDSEQSPDQDFWRRVSRPGNHLDVHKIAGSDKNSLSGFLVDTIPEVVAGQIRDDSSGHENGSSTDATKVINFTGKDWRSELMGSVGINEQNKAILLPGKLSGLQAGQGIILEDAPWDNPDFALWMAQLLTRGKYTTPNGNEAGLPGNLSWCRRALPAEFIACLKKRFSWESAATLREGDQGSIALLNQSLYPSCLKTTTTNQAGQIVSHDALAQWLADATILRVTSPLGRRQWLTLLTRLQTLGKNGLRIIQDQPDEQPEPWQADEQMMPEGHQQPVLPVCSSHLKVVRDDSGLPGYQPGFSDLSITADVQRMEIDQSPAPLTVQIIPDDSLHRLANITEKLSLTSGIVHLTPTDFLSALQTGREIDIFGLELNPDLAAELEPLLQPLPSLNLNGYRHTFAEANIRVHWPTGVKARSPLWQGTLAQASGFPESMALSEWLQVRFDLSSADDARLSRRMIDQVRCLVDKISQLPGTRKSPRHAPEVGHHLLSRIWQQALLEKKLDQCASLSGNHFHKAVNSVLIKPYRSEPESYHYLKWLTRELFAETTDHWIDRVALVRWLVDHPYPTAELVAGHFWQLLRHLPLSAEQLAGNLADNVSAIGPDLPKSHNHRVTHLILPLVQAALVLSAPKVQQPLLQQSLNITGAALDSAREQLKEREPLDHSIESLLRDLFYATGDQLPELVEGEGEGIRALCRSEALAMTRLQYQCCEAEGDVKEQMQAALGQRLDRLFPAKRFPTEAPGEGHQVLIDWIASGNPPNGNDAFWETWQKRRIKRMEEKIQAHPVLFIKGEAGTGKSWMAARVADRLNPDRKPIIYNVNPETTTSDLFGQYQCIDDQGQKAFVFTPGPLKQWASTISDRPVILILDEANLALPALWDCLRGLYQRPACIYWQGRQIPVTAQHRIVMTGNPDYFNGRAMNPFLRQKAPELFFHPLPEAFRAAQIIKPLLNQLVTRITPENHELQSTAALGSMIDGLQTLYRQYRFILPEHEFTPRDLTDCLARMDSYLSGATLTKRQGELSLPMLHSLIFQAMGDTLGRNTLYSEEALTQAALQTWYASRFDCDKAGDDAIVQQKKSEFEDFYRGLRESQRGHQSTFGQVAFDFENAATQALAWPLWLELERRNLEHTRDSAHGGRHATLIEGASGRGKDTLVEFMIARALRNHGEPAARVQRINVSVSNWQACLWLANDAFEKGYCCVFSELNAVQTKLLEGFLNALLTREPAPGFHVIATINPSHFSGRHGLSPALRSRFTYLRIDDYTLADLERIANRQLNNLPLARSLARLHDRLYRAIKNWGSRALPSAGNLSALAAEMGQQPPAQGSQWWSPTFADHYGLFMQMAGWTDKNVRNYAGKDAGNDVSDATDNAPANPADEQWDLTRWLNRVLGKKLDRPVAIRKGATTDFNPDNGVLTLSDYDLRQSESARQTTIVRILAKIYWQKAGLPLNYPAPNDVLASGCYTLWQREQTRQWLGNTEITINVSDLWPMSEEETRTLTLECNGQYRKLPEPFYKERLSAGLLVTMETRLTSPVQTLTEPEEQSMETEAAVNVGSVLSEEIKTGSGSNVWKEKMAVISCQGVEEYQSTHLTHYLKTDCKQPDLSLLKKSETFTLDSQTEPLKRTVTKTGFFQKRDCNRTITGYRELVEKDGAIVEASITMGRHGFNSVMAARVDDPVTVPKNQDYGVAQLKGWEQQAWYPLPGISPHQKLVALSVSPEVPVEIIQDRYTGTLLIKPETVISSGLRVDYKLEPLENPLVKCHTLPPGHNATCPASLQQDLDSWFAGQPRWRQRFAADTPEKTADNIISHCTAFRGGALADQTVKSSGQNLIAMAVEQTGSCRHRARVATMLMNGCGIPCRMASSQTHQWIQYSLNGGLSWQEQDLGGASHSESVYVTQPAALKKVVDEPQKVSLSKQEQEKAAVSEATIKQLAGQVIDQLTEQQVEKLCRRINTDIDGETMQHILRSAIDLPAKKTQESLSQTPLYATEIAEMEVTALEPPESVTPQLSDKSAYLPAVGGALLQQSSKTVEEKSEQTCFQVKHRKLDKNTMEKLIRALLRSCDPQEVKLGLTLLVNNGKNEETVSDIKNYALKCVMFNEVDFIVSLLCQFDRYPALKEELIEEVFWHSNSELSSAYNKNEFEFYFAIVMYCISIKPKLSSKIYLGSLLKILKKGDCSAVEKGKVLLAYNFRIRLDRPYPLSELDYADSDEAESIVCAERITEPAEVCRVLKCGSSLSLEKAMISSQDIITAYSWEPGVLDEIRLLQQKAPFIKPGSRLSTARSVILLGFGKKKIDYVWYVKSINKLIDCEAVIKHVNIMIIYCSGCDASNEYINNQLERTIPDVKKMEDKDRADLLHAIKKHLFDRDGRPLVSRTHIGSDSNIIKIPGRVIMDSFIDYFLKTTSAESREVKFYNLTSQPKYSGVYSLQTRFDFKDIKRLSGKIYDNPITQKKTAKECKRQIKAFSQEDDAVVFDGNDIDTFYKEFLTSILK